MLAGLWCGQRHLLVVKGWLNGPFVGDRLDDVRHCRHRQVSISNSTQATDEEGQDLQNDPQEAAKTPNGGFEEFLEEATNTIEGAMEATDN